MATKKAFINYKKIPYYLVLSSLTVGASLILGFLSFGGMFALLPVLPLAFATFALSVAYEGEIYLQNIKGALNKLFKRNYLKNHLAKEYLLEKFPEDKYLEDPNCPQFLKDYVEQLKLLNAFDVQLDAQSTVQKKQFQLNKDSKKRKKQIEKTLADMEKWFAQQLFSASKNDEESPYTQALKEWLKQPEQEQSIWQKRLAKRQSTFNVAKGFSALAALFMGIGSTYLIVEAFTVIPAIAAISFTLWPVMILPMAIIAGIAYGLLTYNAITDLINNETIKNLYIKFVTNVKKGQLLMPIATAFLLVIATALTLCTAGTWWTVVSNARPLFSWMGKMPSFIMGVINPIITGISTLIFNSENIAESLEMIEEATESKTNIFHRMGQAIKEGFAHIKATENWLQILNPFRLLLKLTVTPLKIIFFLGHLVSIAMTSDRVPGVPKLLSLLVAIISEGFEDLHYFVGSENNKKPHSNNIKELMKDHLEEASDDHGTDIPTRVIKGLALPLYFLAAGWDWLTSKINRAPSQEHVQPNALTFKQAWNKQLGKHQEMDVPFDKQALSPSREWQATNTVSLIEKYEQKHFKNIWVGSELAQEKRNALVQLKDKVRKAASNEESIEAILSTEAKKEDSVYNKHRIFSSNHNSKTATQEFIEALCEQAPHNI